MNEETQGYVGPPEIHDARVRKISRRGADLQVELETVEHRQLLLRFSGVAEIREHRPLGMMVYAVRREPIAGQKSRFIFVNWDDNDDASLEVDATEASF